jgi:hypothetical protein
MFRMLLVILLAGLGSASLARAEAVRHTGVVAAVQPDGRAITLEEMGPWTAPKQGVVTRAIALTSETKVATVTLAKLTAVLNAESGDTAPRPSGFSGRTPCSRWSA